MTGSRRNNAGSEIAGESAGNPNDGDRASRTLLDAIPDELILIRRVKGRLSFEPARRPDDDDLDPESGSRALHRTLSDELASEFEEPFNMACLGATPTVQFGLERDQRMRYMEARLVPLGGKQVLAIVRDMTAQKEIECQIQESQRLEALGRLAGGIAHDFNNLLTVITANADLALTDESSGQEMQEIVAAARRASELTRQLLAFCSRQSLEPRTIDLNELVSGTERMLRRLIGENISLRVSLEEELCTILADPGRIEQVIVNLAVNARDAMPDGGILLFQTDSCDIYETRVGDDLRIPSGRYVRLTVSDTGIGMDRDTRSHIFEPFFTTKASSGGTGLGLSSVYGIVKQSGGYIWVYSEPDQGTVFKVYFPRSEATDEVIEREPPAMTGSSSGETILLVEDDPGVLDLARAILKQAGYNVVAAGSGEGALKIASDYGDKIHLVATDVVMPGMSGRDLARDLEQVRPGLKVLYMSGYGEETVQRYGIQCASTHFLEKPYGRVALLEAVRRAVDAPAQKPTAGT